MKKVLSVVLIIIILISNINVYAFEKIENLELRKIRDCEILLTYKNKRIKTSFIETEIDGKKYPCYCINPELPGIGELGDYNVKVEKILENDSLIYKAIKNGYPYKTATELGVLNEDEAYTATKQAINSMIYGRYTDMSCYGSVNTEAGDRTLKALNKIVREALNESNVQSTNEIEEITDWKIENDRCIKKYQIKSENITEYDIKIEGNVPDTLRIKKDEKQFEIQIPIKDMKESVDFIINIKGKIKSRPVLYGESANENSQNYAISGIVYEDINLEYQDSYDKNKTKFKIIKIDGETEERLEGIKFQILNSNKEVFFDNVLTDSKGEIILEEFIPGKYYIKEIETIEGYEIHKELIEVNIEYNEDNVIKIKNIKKEIPEKSDIPKLPKTGY